MMKTPMKKLVENEAMFRKRNEAVQKDIDEVNTIAHDQGDGDVITDDMVLEFYRECSDENCRQRIPMKIELYKQIHTDRKQFIVVPGHEVDAIEAVIDTGKTFSIVKKRMAAPEFPEGFNMTAVNNA